MPVYYSIPLFFGSLALVVGGSIFLSRALGHLGPRLHIPEQLLGFITALGADSPEIASAVAAMLSGQMDVGVGVVFGSNLFNLASLLGVTAVISGGIAVRRAAASLDGIVGILITVVAVALVTGVAPPPLAAGLVMALMVPYAVLLALPRESLERLPLPASWKPFVIAAASEAQEDSRKMQEPDEEDERRPPESPPESAPQQKPANVLKVLSVLLGALAVIVMGSTGLVRSSTWLTAGWLPRGLLGTLVLAALTGIPNVYTASRLAMRQRGSAVMTETMNSNSLNILVGLAIPSMIFGGLTAHTAGGYLDIAWLLGMTVAVVYILVTGQGLNRRQGAGTIAAYGIFVVIRVCLYLM